MLRKHAYGRKESIEKGEKSLEKRKNKKDMANFLFLFFFSSITLPNYISRFFNPFCTKLIFIEALHWSCSAKKMFLKNSQNSQENICAGASEVTPVRAFS